MPLKNQQINFKLKICKCLDLDTGALPICSFFRIGQILFVWDGEFWSYFWMLKFVPAKEMLVCLLGFQENKMRCFSHDVLYQRYHPIMRPVLFLFNNKVSLSNATDSLRFRLPHLILLFLSLFCCK